MATSIFDARTVSIVKPYTVESRTGINGQFESAEVLFRIAVDRPYKTTRMENGKQVTGYPTDFWLAKATGPIAKVFADHCSSTKEDGKLQSRHLLLEGSFETYKKNRVYENDIQVDLSAYGIQGLVPIHIKDELPDTNTIFMVSSIKFLDRNPNAQVQSQGAVATAGIAGVVGVAGTAQAVPAPTQTISAPAQAVVPVQATAPIQAIAPVQAVTPAQTATPVTPVQAIAPVQTTVPTVDPNFAVQGATAPF